MWPPIASESLRKMAAYLQIELTGHMTRLSQPQ